MNRELITHYSQSLNREMHILVHGHSGTPLFVFPCQDGMADNWESFQMHETLKEEIESGKIQLFSVDTVDRESWSDKNGDKGHRAWVQECYFHYCVDEALPLISHKNATGRLPVVTGFSLGASHAVNTFFRRPDLFSGVIALSGCYDTAHFWDGWMNATLYDNSPIEFLRNMPENHPWITLYNQKRIAVCVGQGRWENEGRRTTAMLRDVCEQKGINGWFDFWGFDVDHDWPWWRQQIRYFLPWVLQA